MITVERGAFIVIQEDIVEVVANTEEEEGEVMEEEELAMVSDID